MNQIEKLSRIIALQGEIRMYQALIDPLEQEMKVLQAELCKEMVESGQKKVDYDGIGTITYVCKQTTKINEAKLQADLPEGKTLEDYKYIASTSEFVKVTPEKAESL